MPKPPFADAPGRRAIRAGRLLDVDFADLVAVDGDPTVDVTVLERPVIVVKGGRLALDARAG